VLVVSSGWAQVAPGKVAADAAFDEGKRLMAQGNHEAACARFAESQRLDPASSTLLWLGECLEKSGKLASAWSTFREAASLAARQGKTDREQLARDRVASLEPRVPRLVLLPREVPEGLVVELDGVALGSALWKTPLPVDPGTRILVLRAPGRQEARLSIQIQAQGGSLREVELPPLLPLAPAAASSSASAAPPPASAPGSPPAPPAPSGPPVQAGGLSGRQIGGLALGGAGLVLGVVGGILQGGARSKADDARARRDRPLYDEASRQQTAAVSAMIVGGALLAGGAALLLLPSSAGSSTALRLVPQVSRREPSLWLTGSF
jgi:hypothetical protein